jgi:hypothetical protein
MSFIDELSKVSGVVPHGSVFAQPAHGRTKRNHGQIKKACSRQPKQTLQNLAQPRSWASSESSLEAAQPHMRKFTFVLLLIDCSYPSLAVRVSEQS